MDFANFDNILHISDNDVDILVQTDKKMTELDL